MWAGVDVLGGNQNQDKYHSGFAVPLYLVARLHLQRPSNIWPKRAAPRLPQKRSAKVVLLFAVLGARWMRRALRIPRTLATTLLLVDDTKKTEIFVNSKTHNYGNFDRYSNSASRNVYCTPAIISCIIVFPLPNVIISVEKKN